MCHETSVAPEPQIYSIQKRSLREIGARASSKGKLWPMSGFVWLSGRSFSKGQRINSFWQCTYPRIQQKAVMLGSGWGGSGGSDSLRSRPEEKPKQHLFPRTARHTAVPARPGWGLVSEKHVPALANLVLCLPESH